VGLGEREGGLRPFFSGGFISTSSLSSAELSASEEDSDDELDDEEVCTAAGVFSSRMVATGDALTDLSSSELELDDEEEEEACLLFLLRERRFAGTPFPLVVGGIVPGAPLVPSRCKA
jgi:hypothetical protein